MTHSRIPEKGLVYVPGCYKIHSVHICGESLEYFPYPYLPYQHGYFAVFRFHVSECRKLSPESRTVFRMNRRSFLEPPPNISSGPTQTHFTCNLPNDIMHLSHPPSSTFELPSSAFCHKKQQVLNFTIVFFLFKVFTAVTGKPSIRRTRAFTRGFYSVNSLPLRNVCRTLASARQCYIPGFPLCE